ncbi:MAG: CBS domain-containing protein [Myxococcales bacterium]|nr:CBS domain-containing protein [Myxococcales bacterium]
MREKTSDWMMSDVITTTAEQPLRDAVALMRRHNIRHLCVVGACCRLVGVLTDRDVKRTLPSAAAGSAREDYELALDGLTVQQAMTRDPVTARPGGALGVTAEAMLRGKFGMIPVVVDSGRLVGVVTQTELLRALLRLLRAQ